MTLVATCLVIPQRMRLSGTVTEIWRLKNNGVTTLTFWGHVSLSVTWPFDSRSRLPMGGPSWPCVYLAPLRRYGASKIMESRVWPFGVTWRHRSRDHSTLGVDFLWVVFSDHASIWHRYGDMAVWSSSRKALPETDWGRSLVGRRSVLNITLILYTRHRDVRNVALEE